MHYTSWGTALGVALAVLASPAAAESQKDETVAVVVDGRTCLGLTEVSDARGIAPADGGAYRPGTDVRGRAVVPAEGPGGGADWSGLADTLKINVEVDLVERYGTALPSGSTLPLGTIELRDGRAWFNGQPLAGHDREALWQACRRLGVLQRKADQPKP